MGDGKVLASTHYLKQWNAWLTQSHGGQRLLNEESDCLVKWLENYFSKYAVLIGVPQQLCLIQHPAILHGILLSSLAPSHAFPYIEVDYQELPITTGQVDLVVLPHILECVEHPRQLLAEACRIVKPEGLIIIFGFNPYSLFKLTQWWLKKSGTPWSRDILPLRELKKWLELASFQIEKQRSFMYRPLLQSASIFEKLALSEWLGARLLPDYGSVYALLARAKEIPLTPIKLKWKQQLNGIRIAPTITSHLVREKIE